MDIIIGRLTLIFKVSIVFQHILFKLVIYLSKKAIVGYITFLTWRNSTLWLTHDKAIPSSYMMYYIFSNEQM